VDLLVIRTVRGARLSVERRMLSAMAELGLATDIVLVTPREFEEQRNLPGTLARTAAREGRVLYAAG